VLVLLVVLFVEEELVLVVVDVTVIVPCILP
jgi:hypothetical protein